jgi:hypothetical protein
VEQRGETPGDFHPRCSADLTIIARARGELGNAGAGADWLYTYLRTFYQDNKRPTGWNNVVFANVGMPHVLWELQGELVMGADHKVRFSAALSTAVMHGTEHRGWKSPGVSPRCSTAAVYRLQFQCSGSRRKLRFLRGRSLASVFPSPATTAVSLSVHSGVNGPDLMLRHLARRQRRPFSI